MSLLQKLKAGLKQPYPFYFEGRSLWTLLLILAVMGIVFQYFFKPFDVYLPEHRMSFFAITVVHTANALLIILAGALVLKLLPGVTAFWNVGKEIVFLTALILAIGVGQFLIRDLIYDNPNNWSLGYLLEEVRNSFLVGILFISILLPINFNRLIYQNQKKAAALHHDQKPKNSARPVDIKTQVKQDDFTLNPSELIYARAEGNYVTLCLDGKSEEKLIKRISLTELENQLKAYPFIVRTHRSYLVNLHFIRAINGNAQGYVLDLQNTEERIAVSRKMIPVFERKLRAA